MRAPIMPDREGFGWLAGQGNLIPVYAEVLADIETPVSAYMKLEGMGDRFLLESAEHGERFARYSFVGAGATVVFKAKDGVVTITEGGLSRRFECEDDPLRALEGLMARYKPAPVQGDLPLFYGGAVGFLAYEAVRYFEPTVPVARSGALFPSSTGTPECSQLLSNDSWYAILLMVITMTAGTGLIMWMGELITERGIGNGMSLLIFISIAATWKCAVSAAGNARRI